MNTVEIRKLPTKDLAAKSNELREDIINLKRKISLGEVENVRLVRQRRKDLARVLTVLSEQLEKETR